MPFNLSGTLAAIGVLFNPRLIVPSLTVPDIRYLNWRLLWENGYRGVVFDRDNCITRPHEDDLIQELKVSFEECKQTFGAKRTLIVSNSAGAPLDVGYLAAESLERNLQVPVLKHEAMKPSRKCIKSIKKHFSTHPTPLRLQPDPTTITHQSSFQHSSLPPCSDTRLVVIGDRILTDVLMGNHKDFGPRGNNLTVLTQHVWVPESLGIRLLRKGENLLAAWISQREDVKEELESYRKFAKTREEVLGKETGMEKGEKPGREVVWEGRSGGR